MEEYFTKLLSNSTLEQSLKNLEAVILDAQKKVDKMLEEREKYLKERIDDKKRLEWLVWKENLN
mgnify:CR=1 FL=1